MALREPRRSALVCAFLALATLAVYWPVAFYPFTNFDDTTYVSNNPWVMQGLGWEGIRWAFTTFYFANWHPLNWLSHMTDVELFGTWAGGHHLTSVALHCLNSALVFLVLRRMTGAVWRSAAVAALFALHPLHVESVAWVSERKDVLSSCFGLLALLCYASYARRPRPLALLATTACFYLALMTKPMLVTLPFAMLLLDYWPLERLDWPLERERVRGLVLEKLPMFAAVAASCVVTVIAQERSGTIGETASVGLRLANAGVSYLRYLGNAFWPRDLSVFYPYPDAVPLWQAVGAVLILAGVTAAVVHLAPRRRYPLVGWLWFVGMLIPVIGLIQVGPQAMADRYAYLPVTGLFVAAVWGAHDVITRWPRYRSLAVGTAASALAACGVVSSLQVTHWQSSIHLFQHALDATGESSLVLNNLGSAFVDAKRYDEALAPLTRAIELEPRYAAAWSSLGSALFWLGRPVDAVEHYRIAAIADPEHAKAQLGLAASLAAVGRPDLALAHARRAVDLQPHHPRPRSLLAKIERDLVDAPPPSEYRYVPAQRERVLIHLAEGNSELALRELEKILERHPEDEFALRRMAVDASGRPLRGTN